MGQDKVNEDVRERLLQIVWQNTPKRAMSTKDREVACQVLTVLALDRIGDLLEKIVDNKEVE